MPNTDHLKILKKGVKEWNRWRQRQPQSEPDLRLADLRGIDVPAINLSGALLEAARCNEADFSRANFEGADLRYASLHGSRTFGANFRRTQLFGADLSGGKFMSSDFSKSQMGCTVLANVDLRGAKGLDSVRHRGPSHLGVDSLHGLRGVPLAFLRGIGVADRIIEYLPSLIDDPIQFYSCFISYSTKDQDFADRLHADLQNKGVRCWFAPHDIKAGKKLHEQIDEAIRLYDRLLLILSRHSMDSEWVKTEIAHARQKELNERRQVLFPITLVPFVKIREWKCFDADAGKDSAREIREYFIPDFSNWKDHDSYQKAFERLVPSLKAQGVGAAPPDS